MSEYCTDTSAPHGQLLLYVISAAAVLVWIWNYYIDLYSIFCLYFPSYTCLIMFQIPAPDGLNFLVTCSYMWIHILL